MPVTTTRGLRYRGASDRVERPEHEAGYRGNCPADLLCTCPTRIWILRQGSTHRVRVSCDCASLQLPSWSGQPAGRSKTISPPLFLREGLAQLLLLLLWQVGRDDLEVVLLQFVDHLVGSGRPAGQGKQSGGALRDLLADLLDEIVADSNVRQRP